MRQQNMNTHDPIRDDANHSVLFPYPFTGQPNCEVRLPLTAMVQGESFVRARIEGWFKDHERPRPGQVYDIPEYQFAPYFFNPRDDCPMIEKVVVPFSVNDMTGAQVPLPRIDQRIRFAIEYRSVWRPLGWVRAGIDGSIYMGTLIDKPASAKEVDKPAERLTTIEDREFQEAIPIPKSSRLSFHPSGEVHIGNKVVPGLVPLHDLHGSQQLCIMRFRHPGTYEPPAKKNANDFDLDIIGYQVDEERPTYGAIIVAPRTAETHLPARLPNMTQFAGIVVGMGGFTKTPDLLIAIVLGHGPKGPWPETPSVGVLSRAGGPTEPAAAG